MLHDDRPQWHTWCNRVCIALFSLCLTLAWPAFAFEEHEAGTITVYPPKIVLQDARASQRFVVIATHADGTHRNVTDGCTIEGGEGVVAVTEHTILPRGDGQGHLRITHAESGLSVELPVTVIDSNVERPPSFALDVMPVFMAAGCNTGGCHGSARGQDGFRLSLFGFDPAGDYRRITREFAGRRVNLARPDASLLLEKATGDVIHTGGKRFDRESAHYQAIHRWIAAGAPADGDNVASVIDLQLYPDDLVLRGAGQQVPLVAVARYSNGMMRDVSDLAVFRTNNDTSVAVADGVIASGEPGEAFITASFDTFTVGSPVIVLAADAPHAITTEETTNYVDAHINRKLAALRIVPSALCDDETFLRRVTIDLTGKLPTPEERAAFLADTAPDRRARLIDQLLERREFVDQWVMTFAELLQIRSNNEISYKSALLYFEWLRNSFANDVPLDEMVRRILTSTGGTFTEPATNFYQNQPDNMVLAENVAQAFMGIRIQCAQCHNHPFDRWTQNDYYGFVSFFSQVGRKRAEDQRETIVFNRRSGDVQHPVTNQVVQPTFLGGGVAEVGRRDRREVIAEWLTAPENPYFARSFANRIWAHFMGRGIVEPVDDFRISNPPANGPLLDALAERFIASGYSIKDLCRDICNSRAYQRSTATNDSNRTDERNFARAAVRRVRAETLLDMIGQVTGVPSKFRGLPVGARAVEIADGSTTTYFLTTFGRARRESVCSCEVVREPSLSQALHLLNGETVHNKVNNSAVIRSMIDAGVDDRAIVTGLFVRTLMREPTDEEMAAILESIDPEKRGESLNDVFWAILNSNEFVFNH